ncbi:sensor histidine kinase [Urbifossiella limnaea]|uniref:Signal transduction histidine-protein kinase/phosphatase MprB n=1 Tax=Urbifossiella limnaea TaxID=2528023 RepID=A0A517XY74_9BACT|nr:HAMP domain-containing sensor histidine kinase [Urbifossiella limnaea]QDU22466.1 Globin-coupled histidine kinase [Urbifossiella limnaea]
MRLSLRYRLLLPLTLLLAGDVAATAWAAAGAARAAERQLAAQLWAVATTVTEPPGYPLSERVLHLMKGFSGAEFILDRPGAAPVGTLADPATPPPADVPPAPRDEDDHLGPPVLVGGVEYRCLRLPLSRRLADPGPSRGELYILLPEERRRTAVQAAARPLIVLGGAGGLVAVALALALGTGLVRRLHTLDGHTRRIAGGDFTPVPVPGPADEVADLYRAVNAMAGQLAEYRDALARAERLRVLGQFAGGLAHQLRNAAAGAKLSIELFLTENPAADPEPLRVALRQLARIEANLRQFLTAGKPPPFDPRPCDLAELLAQAVELARPRCQHAGITLHFDPPPPHAFAGDPAQLAHLFGNLIDNAADAAGPGGDVAVSLAAGVVVVSDSGAGPPADLAAKLFEPFVTGKPEGIGLGLAVAKRAADAHGAALTWGREGGRTVFRVAFPS